MPAAPLFHGGRGGLRRGDLLRPPAETSFAAEHAARAAAGSIGRADRVYVTTSLEAAHLYAVLHPSGRGIVYEVEPVGALEDDPDCTEPGLSFAVPSARVLRVIQISRADRAAILAVAIAP